MDKRRSAAHPYIPNSARAAKEAMLREVGATSEDDLYEDIPEALRFRGGLALPEPLASEAELRRHVEGLLSKNRSCAESLSFLGAGCTQHFVPAVCDEINGRAEFLTAYAGEPYDDHGRFQALFEYASLMGELLDMDVVTVTTYDGFQAAATGRRSWRPRPIVTSGTPRATAISTAQKRRSSSGKLKIPSRDSATSLSQRGSRIPREPRRSTWVPRNGSMRL